MIVLILTIFPQNEDLPAVPDAAGLPPALAMLPRQQPGHQPPLNDDDGRGYVRMAVMDGKTIVHRVSNAAQLLSIEHLPELYHS